MHRWWVKFRRWWVYGPWLSVREATQFQKGRTDLIDFGKNLDKIARGEMRVE